MSAPASQGAAAPAVSARPPARASSNGSRVAADLDRVDQLEQAVSRLEAEVRRLTGLAHTDELTGLPNRRALQAALGRELAHSTRVAEPL